MVFLSYNDTYYGEETFLGALTISTIVELIFTIFFATITYLLYSLVKKVSKGLREEKKRYGNKHRRKGR
jgi:hypothetical protein